MFKRNWHILVSGLLDVLTGILLATNVDQEGLLYLWKDCVALRGCRKTYQRVERILTTSYCKKVLLLRHNISLERLRRLLSTAHRQLWIPISIPPVLGHFRPLWIQRRISRPEALCVAISFLEWSLGNLGSREEGRETQWESRGYSNVFWPYNLKRSFSQIRADVL